MDAHGIIDNINTIYERFELPPNLKMHMYRVAAVGEMICDHWNNREIKVDKEEVIAACLVHDLGNIAKMGFETDHELVMLGDEARNADRWKAVKRRLVERYGKTPDEMTLNMAREMGFDDRMIFMVENGGGGALLLTDKIIDATDWELKIFSYCDCRVVPYGISSARERIEDLLERYGGIEGRDFMKQVSTVERQIFSNVSIAPDEINERSAAHCIKRYMES